MPLIIMGTFSVPPARLAQARPVMAKMLEESRAETGCLHYAYAEDLETPGLILVSEIWRSRADLEAHFASAHLAAWRARWSELGIGDRNLQRFEAMAAEPT